MTTTKKITTAALLMGLWAGSAAADGMIVPVRPDIRVRGSWAVKYHHVEIKVRNQVAAVNIDQEFVNTGRGTIEVEYLFPIPPGAAVDSMTLVVNGKEFAARLLKAEEARRIYESIVRKKKDPALLEYAGFGLYKTRAFPLEPGKPCKIIVTYKNVCRKDGGAVEVWYPLNTEKFSARPIESVRVRVDIKTAADIGPIYSPTHNLRVDRKGPRRVIATYETKKALPTTDFQLFYKAADTKVGATLLTYQPAAGRDGYFMLLVSPNPRSAARSIIAKDVVLVLDHSGSMSGKKIEQAKEALGYVLKNLNSEDRFNVVAYNDGVETFYPGLVPASPEKVSDAVDTLDSIEATGGTNIHEALLKAVGLVHPKGAARRGPPRPAYVIFLTDGQPTVGNTKEADILLETKKANAGRARIFAFGVGYRPNVRLLDKLAIQNGGRSDYVKPAEPIEAKVSSLYKKIRNPVMTRLEVALQGVRLRQMYPRDLGDLFDGDQMVVTGRYSAKDVAGLPGGSGAARRGMLVVKGLYEGRERAFEYPVDIRTRVRDMRFAFVEKIWAVRRVGYLLDQIQLHGKSQEVVDELIRLSRTHGIMTPYTSFLADETTRLHLPAAVRRRAAKAGRELGGRVSGGGAQRWAHARGRLKRATSGPQASEFRKGRKKDTVAMFGHLRQDQYEAEKVEYVAGVRTVGNQALYRRGRVWIAAEAADLDLADDAARIQVVHRFSDEYFKLIYQNTIEENQVMASQQAGEELVIRLRGQTYRIK